MVSAAADILSLIFVITTDDDILKSEYFVATNSVKISLHIESLIQIVLGVISENDNVKDNQDFFNQTTTLSTAREQINQILDNQIKLLAPDGTKFGSIIGYNEYTDSLLLEEEKGSTIIIDLHSSYVKTGVNQLIVLFCNLGSEIISKISTYGTIANHSNFKDIFHLTFSHLIPKMIFMNDFLMNQIIEFPSSFQNQLSIILGITICLSFLLSNSFIYFYTLHSNHIRN